MATPVEHPVPETESGLRALPVDELQSTGRDDQDEWEYEYSTTETETYYLTIELSYPEFKEKANKVHYHSRGGYYKNWLDQQPEQEGQPIPTTERGHADQDDDDEPLPEPEADDAVPDDAGDIDPRLLGAKPSSKTVEKQAATTEKSARDGEAQDKDEHQEKDTAPTEDIQIMELHSHKPLISYRGRVFEGQWAEVIGTEAILANREEDNPLPLPALRNLPGEVDLLAASSSRILTTERMLKPKVPAEDALAPIRQQWNIRIPTGKDKTGERAQQTRFLENLMALKKKRGETDHVTVYARDGKGKNFKDNKDPDAKPRRRKMASGVEEQARVSRRRVGRPRGRGKRSDGQVAGLDDDMSTVEPDSLSTPTPHRWEDLYKIRNQDMAAGGQSEEEDDDDDEDDEEELDSVSKTADERIESDGDVTMAD